MFQVPSSGHNKQGKSAGEKNIYAANCNARNLTARKSMAVPCGEGVGKMYTEPKLDPRKRVTGSRKFSGK